MSPRVYIVILTYNDWGETLECLNSLSSVIYPNVEIVVVDNASTDPSSEKVATDYPQVHVIRNRRNLGYAGGNNVGLEYALKNGADYALVLNNDTILSPDFLSLLVEAAESHPEGAFFGPLVYHHDEPQVIQSAGGFVGRDWRFYHRGQNQPDEGQFRSVEAVAWVTGCAIMSRRRALEVIGLLDSDFFIYSEEVDWCLRAREAGYRVLFVPRARIWHKGVRRDYDPSPRVTYLSARNELHLLAKHHAGPLALTGAVLRHLRTLASWSLRPRWRGRRQHRNALAFALRDFVRGKYGAPPLTF